jgi:hypothetical protein
MRAHIALIGVAIWLALATTVLAQSDAQTAPPSDQPADQAAPSDQPAEQAPLGPILQASDTAPVICDPATRGFRYVEVRGSGFDAWASQRLVGNLLDGSGTPQVHWGSVWVSPRGGLTLELNLCADPFRSRAALAAGTYTVAVGDSSGAAIAATNIDLAAPPEPPAEGDLPVPIASTTTPARRTGPGSIQQPFPLGALNTLVDGWQLQVTGVTPDAWSGIHAAVPSSIAPAADQRDFMVRVRAVYQGQGTGVFSAMRLALVSGIQTTYDQLHNGCGVVPDMVPPNLVTPGGEVRGNVCFTVRASDIGALVLFDNQSLDIDRLYFALH